MSPDRDTGKGPDEHRRGFLKGAVNGIAVLLGLLFAILTGATLMPGSGARRREAFIPLMDEDEAPRRGVREVTYSYARGDREMRGKVFLVASPEGLIALSPACTHLACYVLWDDEAGEFLCPCHGGRYDRSGRNIAGPPPGPLARFPLQRREGLLYVKVPT